MTQLIKKVRYDFTESPDSTEEDSNRVKPKKKKLITTKRVLLGAGALAGIGTAGVAGIRAYTHNEKFNKFVNDNLKKPAKTVAKGVKTHAVNSVNDHVNKKAKEGNGVYKALQQGVNDAAKNLTDQPKTWKEKLSGAFSKITKRDN